LRPERINSKYRRFTDTGILLCAQRGIRTSSHRTFATIPRHQGLYPVLLIDAIVVKIRDGQVANRPIYVAMGINLEGERDVLGLWVGPAGGRAPSSG
jgi:hypothetical protein